MTTLDLDGCALELQELGHQHGAGIGPWAGIVSARQYRWLTKQVHRFVPPGSHVLDWGCGQGFFSYWLLRNGYRVAASDLHQPLLRASLEELSQEGFHFEPLVDCRRLPFPDASFDAVLSVGVLEHVVDSGGTEAGSLAEIRRVLKPGGWFICAQFPNRFGWVEPVVRRIAPSQHWHHCRYTKAEVERLAQEGGLRMVLHTRYGFLPRNLAARLPPRYRNSRALAAAYDGLDRALSVPFGLANQNHGWVSRKPGTPSATDRGNEPVGGPKVKPDPR